MEKTTTLLVLIYLNDPNRYKYNFVHCIEFLFLMSVENDVNKRGVKKSIPLMIPGYNVTIFFTHELKIDNYFIQEPAYKEV